MNTNMKQNTSFKATAEVHVFIDFNCAAIFWGGDLDHNEKSIVHGRGGTPDSKGVPH